MVNGMKVRCRRRYQMIDNIIINDLYAGTKRKAEKREEENAEFVKVENLVIQRVRFRFPIGCMS